MADEQQPYVEPSHRLPDKDWADVVRHAGLVNRAYVAEHGEPVPPADLDGVE
jgi:hypothetical protein